MSLTREEFEQQLKDKMPNSNLLSAVIKDRNRFIVKANYGAILKPVGGTAIQSIEVKNGTAKVIYQLTDPKPSGDNDMTEEQDQTTEEQNDSENQNNDHNGGESDDE